MFIVVLFAARLALRLEINLQCCDLQQPHLAFRGCAQLLLRFGPLFLRCGPSSLLCACLDELRS